MPARARTRAQQARTGPAAWDGRTDCAATDRRTCVCVCVWDGGQLHCWQAVRKAVRCNLYHPETFDVDEYFYYDHPTNGDMHEVVTGKFFAFKGPTDRPEKYYTKRPLDYVDVFKAKKIKAVVRLNNKQYDARILQRHGLEHYDLFFTDCSTPSDSIVEKFLRLAEDTDGSLAVHCLAGLGRTGTLIGLWMMKHMHFTANECIGWLRIVRPGSVIGPQQQYLKDQEQRMWALGKSGVTGLGLAQKQSNSLTDLSALASSYNADLSAQLADQSTNGMSMRDSSKFDKAAKPQQHQHQTPPALDASRRSTHATGDAGGNTIRLPKVQKPGAAAQPALRSTYTPRVDPSLRHSTGSITTTTHAHTHGMTVTTTGAPSRTPERSASGQRRSGAGAQVHLQQLDKSRMSYDQLNQLQARDASPSPSPVGSNPRGRGNSAGRHRAGVSGAAASGSQAQQALRVDAAARAARALKY